MPPTGGGAAGERVHQLQLQRLPPERGHTRAPPFHPGLLPAPQDRPHLQVCVQGRPTIYVYWRELKLISSALNRPGLFFHWHLMGCKCSKALHVRSSSQCVVHIFDAILASETNAMTGLPTMRLKFDILSLYDKSRTKSISCSLLAHVACLSCSGAVRSHCVYCVLVYPEHAMPPGHKSCLAYYDLSNMCELF